jgi:hydrogenase expression/formation protein HypD
MEKYFLKNKTIIFWLEQQIGRLSKVLPKVKIMHVCGTHEYVISRYGLRNLLPGNLEVISGPGCPVCCTPAADIDALLDLGLTNKVTITSFGDMLRVKGSSLSLSQAKAQGAKVKMVYSILDAVEFARANKGAQVVHAAIGFETTAPTTAAVLADAAPTNFSILSSHRLIPPAMDFLLKNKEDRIDGFIAPGHVSVIIGGNAYKGVVTKYARPVVIAGFEPVDILYSIYLILKQIKGRIASVEIEYKRVVTWSAQQKALRLMNKVFDKALGYWRGIGNIPDSALVLKKSFQRFDALKKFNLKKKKEPVLLRNCLCAQVLKGKIYPYQCPAFARRCTPENPVGPCMVSIEGSCAISYAHRDKQKP